MTIYVGPRPLAPELPRFPVQILDQHPHAVARERRGRAVGVAAGDVWHDRGVDYPQQCRRLPETSASSFSRRSYRSINTRSRSSAIAVPDPEIVWTLLLENDLATLAREIPSRHRVDRPSLCRSPRGVMP